MTKDAKQLLLLLFVLGFIGILSSLPMTPLLLNHLGEEPDIPVILLQVITALQSTLILLLFLFIGHAAASRVSLQAPLLTALVSKETALPDTTPILFSGIIGGILGASALLLSATLFIPLLPEQFAKTVDTLTPPWYTKLLYGGITEEILIRWGLMSFLTWLFYRIFQKGKNTISSTIYILAIVVSSLLFGIGHLPLAAVLSDTLSPMIIAYVLTANTLFGLIAGFLFWKRGLGAAIIAHITTHLIILGTSLI